MGIFDLFLTPIYLIFIYGFLYILRQRIQEKEIRVYFIPAFTFKVIGAISLGLIYQFYYGGGDTFNFYRDSNAIFQAFLNSPFTAFQLIFASVGDFSPELYQYTRQIYFFSAGDSQTFNVIRISGFFSLISFNTYSVIALFFAMISFSGMWAMYRAFYTMFPQLHRPLAYAIFFIPSVYFWGSGLSKDSIIIGALGWLFHSFYFGIIRRQNVIQNVIILLIAFYVIQIIKIYIFFWFIPAASLWLFLQFQARIKSSALRIVLFPLIILISIPVALIGLNRITEDNRLYNLENLSKTAAVTQDYLSSYVQSGSAYEIGQFDFSVNGFFSVGPQAIWLGLFRPHPWEFRGSPVMALASIESFIFLYLTFRVLLTIRLARIYNLFTQQPVLIFCLTFSVMAAFSIAITSGNFGTMVRYRIPLMPFYLAMLYIIRYYLNNSKKLI
jgi:hypothetical protein